MVTIRLLGFPVQIQLTFLILAFFAVNAGYGFLGIVLWMATIFLSILIHELGHAVVARWFGAKVHSITVHGFGGVTIWSETSLAVRGWKRFTVAAAGSGVGLMIGLALYVAVSRGVFGSFAVRRIPSPWGFRVFDPTVETAAVFVLGMFILVSVLWGLINWLPVVGLDGAAMLREVLRPMLGAATERVSRAIGLGTAIALGAYLFYIGRRFGVFILAYLVISDYSQQSR